MNTDLSHSSQADLSALPSEENGEGLEEAPEGMEQFEHAPEGAEQFESMDKNSSDQDVQSQLTT